MRKKSKAGLKTQTSGGKPLLHTKHEDQDVILSDDDFEILNEYGQFAGFLSNLNADPLPKKGPAAGKVKILRNSAIENDDMMYNRDEESDNDADQDQNEDEEPESEDEITALERAPRLAREAWSQPKQKVNARLPVVGEDGKLHKVVVEDPYATVALLPRDALAKAKENAAKRKQQREGSATNGGEVDNDVENEKKEATKESIVKKQKKAVLEKPAKLTPALIQAARTEAQEKLAELCTAIIENPEDHISSLRVIRQISEAKDSHIQKIGILSQLAVYRDIIPGYRIRPLTDAEKEAKVSKEVKKLRTFEETLVTNYQNYLQQLENVLNYHSSPSDGSKQSHLSPDPSVAVVAMQCMCDLLTTVTHFNFRVNLMTAVVSKMGSKKPVPEVGIIACNAMVKLFNDDVSGEVSLEGVKLITKMIKSKGFKVDESVLKTFLHLKLNDELIKSKIAEKEEKADKNKGFGDKKRKREEQASQGHVSKKLKKALKREKEVEEDMKEAEAEYTREEKQKWQSESLKFVFLTYFRILKNAEKSPLLPTVLEGLSRFAHLIDIDFFADLIAVLKKITISQYQDYIDGSKDSSTTKSSLHCILAAFQILSGQTESLNIDLKDFNTSLYAQMMRVPGRVGASEAETLEGAMDVRTGVDDDVRGLGLAGGKRVKHVRDVQTRSEVELVLIGMDILFCRKKQIPVDRAAAFLKRLATISLHLKPNAVLACLSLMRAILIKHSKLQQLLDPEERLGTGAYKPFLDDPELCNPYATNLWELNLFMQHYHPTIRTFSRHVAQAESGSYAENHSGPRHLPADLNLSYTDFLKEYDPAPTYPHPTFCIIPRIALPNNIRNGIKRKVDNGMNPLRLSGPTVVEKSEFLKEVEEVYEKCGVEEDSVVEAGLGGGVVVTGDPVVDKLVEREKRLRKMVEVWRETHLDLLDEDEFDDEEGWDEDEDGDGEEEFDGEEMDEDDDEGGMPNFGMPVFGGFGGKGKRKGGSAGEQRAMEFMASRGMLNKGPGRGQK
ncbi:Nucleolar complex protein 3 [Blyttiomyces sp. JEL0837]|nr:Nucleolar complex protein 3 [Blyttiomyces sp. JEL0837]